MDTATRPRELGHGRRHCEVLPDQVPQGAMKHTRMTTGGGRPALRGPRRSTAQDTDSFLSSGNGTPHRGARSLTL
eukprot:3297302-Pyramimonas_sp.AAC.1